MQKTKIGFNERICLYWDRKKNAENERNAGEIKIKSSAIMIHYHHFLKKNNNNSVIISI